MGDQEETTDAPVEEVATPGVMKVSAKSTKMGNRAYEGTYKVGVSIEECNELFGADKVLAGFLANLKIGAQSVIRSCIEASKPDAEIATILAAWKPGTRTTVQADPKQALMAQMASMSKEEKKALLAELMAGAQS